MNDLLKSGICDSWRKGPTSRLAPARHPDARPTLDGQIFVRGSFIAKGTQEEKKKMFNSMYRLIYLLCVDKYFMFVNYPLQYGTHPARVEARDCQCLFYALRCGRISTSKQASRECAENCIRRRYCCSPAKGRNFREWGTIYGRPIRQLQKPPRQFSAIPCPGCVCRIPTVV